VQAAQVIVSRSGDTLVWDAGDFFVPPRLWGVGIGEDFLRRLQRGENPISQAGELVVRLRVDSGDCGTSNKELADTLQLYRSAGFHRLAEGLVSAERHKSLVRRDTAARPSNFAGATERLRWMYATVTCHTESPPIPERRVTGTNDGRKRGAGKQRR
jgi:hypothetical protein